jgi:hypothetical protein
VSEFEERRLEKALGRVEHALAELVSEGKRTNRLLWLLLDEERKEHPSLKGAGFTSVTSISVTAAP